MTDADRLNVVELTVSEVSAALKRTVEDQFGYVRVRGEISGYRGPHSSGHVYFAIKDEGARLDAVIWKGVFGRMRIKPEDGLEVVVTGKITTYPGRSNYQIVVETLEPAGLGALMMLLEERKKKLAAEGLFDEARKQLLPFLPRVIGVVTSPTGAVIRDILHRLDDRFAAPRAGLAGAGAGRWRGRRNCRRHRGLQCAAGRRADPAPGCADRGARRRLAGRPVVLQRGDRGAGGGGLDDPADLGGRARDRHHADRFCFRPARADADGRRRDGGAGALGPALAHRDPGAPHGAPAGCAVRKAAAPNCAPPRARCRRSMRCSPSRASGSMPQASACRARCGAMRMCIIRISRGWPGGCRFDC